MFAVLIPFIVVLTVIVFVHEMGHFLIARHNGVKVASFSIGFGPELFGWTDKKGTRWRVACVPLGGYVMMAGDTDPSSVKSDVSGMDDHEKSQTLMAKTPLQRIAVAFGGPLFNILFSLVVLFAIALGKGIPDGLSRIERIMEGSLAERIGLQSGDQITDINDQKADTYSGLAKALVQFAGQDAVVRFIRNNQKQSVSVPLYTEDDQKNRVPVYKLGVELNGDTVFTKTGVVEATLYSLQTCVRTSFMMVAGLFQSIYGKICGKKGEAKLGGFFTIADQAHKSISGGVYTFIMFMAMLSLSLAVFNLLPIPVLDGGSIFFGFIELIRGRPFTPATINSIYGGGLIIVIALMLWALFNDLLAYGPRMFKWVMNLFH